MAQTLRIILILLMLGGVEAVALAATYYVAPAPVSTPATNCTQAQNEDTPHDTIAEGIACLVAGDTLYLRGGTYPTTQRVNLQEPTVKTGTSTAWITIAGYPGERPVLQYADTIVDGYGPIKARGNIAYIRFENMTLDGVNATSGTRWQIRDGNHHFILRDLEIKNFPGSLLIVADNVSVLNCDIHDAKSASGTYYGIYFSAGVNGLIDGNHIYSNNGGGIHAFPGPISNLTIRNNRVHHNNYAASGSVPGILVYEDIDYNGGTAIIDGVDVYNNVVYKNGVDKPSGTAGGIRVANGAANVRVTNNTVYGNNGYGISVHADTNGPPVNTVVRNNITTNNIGNDYSDTGTGTVVSYLACTAAEPCGSTGKVTLATPDECFVDAANDDYRLKQGTNPCRDAGTSVPMRPAPVGPTDVGAYEQGRVASASVVGGYIEAIVNVMTPGVRPTSNLTAWSVTCVGCTGSPVVSSAVVKGGTSNIVQLTISGITGAGSCTITYGAGNVTDYGYVGPPALGLSQGINSISGLSVAGLCDNSAGGTSPGTLYLHYKLNDGSGTNANDETVNNRDGTLSGAPTWQTPALNGSGLYFPNDGVDRRLSTVYGNAVNPSSQSFTVCVWVKPDTGINNKIVFGTANGTDQRVYAGIGLGGTTWGLGIQSSTITSTGESEFPVVNKWTSLCVVADAATDLATLAVDGVMGTSASARKAYTSFALASDFRVGCGFLTVLYCGGFLTDEVKIWSRALNASELLDVFREFNPVGSAVTCYGQATHKAELVFTDGTNPIAYGQPADSAYEVVDGGGIAPVIQINCTGTAGGPVALRFYYSTNGTDFNNEIPATLGAGGISMWGPSTELGLNNGVATCCISGGLTANHGVTLVASNVSPTINLSTNHSYTIRLLLRFASGLVNQSIWIVAKEDTGLDLANAPTLGPMRFDLVNPRGGGMP